MSKTRLDHHKARWRLNHDGETVLRAAAEEHFPIHLKKGEYRQLTDEILSALGVNAEMTREQVMECLSTRLRENDLQKMGAIRDHIRQVLPDGVTAIHGYREELKQETENLILRLIHDVLVFCDEKIDFSKGDPSRQPPRPKKQHWAVQLLAIIRDMLKLG